MSKYEARPDFSTRAAHLLWKTVPATALLGLLRLSQKGKLPKRLVKKFDPNHLRRYFPRPPRPRYLSVSGPDWSLTVDVNDHIGYRMFITQLPFERSLEILDEALGKSEKNTILDIGANIGSAAIPVCSRSKLKLIAVEASRETAEQLRHNIAKNDIDAQVFQFAIIDDDSRDRVNLKINLGNQGANSIYPTWNPGVDENERIESVPTITLDRLSTNFAASDLKLVKIDVEGAEELVFRGGKNFLEANEAPIVLEYGLDGVRRYLGKTLENVVRLLRDAGYRIFSLETSPLRLAPFIPQHSKANVVALKPHTDSWVRLLPIISEVDKP